MLLYKCFRFSEVMDQMLFLTVRGAVQDSYRATLGVASVFAVSCRLTTKVGSLEMPRPNTHTSGFFFLRC